MLEFLKMDIALLAAKGFAKREFAIGKLRAIRTSAAKQAGEFGNGNTKNLFGKNDYRKELAKKGYIIYGKEKRSFSDLDDTDIDNIIEIPSGTNIRWYIDSTHAAVELIQKINSMTFKNNKERMSYLKEQLKVLKGNQKKLLEKDAFKRIIESKKKNLNERR